MRKQIELQDKQKEIVERMKEGEPLSKEDFSKITLAIMDEWVKKKWTETEDDKAKTELREWWITLCKELIEDPKIQTKKRQRTTAEIKKAFCERYEMMPIKTRYRDFIGDWRTEE